MEGVVDALGMEPFVTGRQPHSRTADITEVPMDATPLPPGVTADLTHEQGGLRSHLASGPEWTLVALRRRAGAATVRVCATSGDLADEVLAAAVGSARTGELSAPAGKLARRDAPGSGWGLRSGRFRGFRRSVALFQCPERRFRDTRTRRSTQNDFAPGGRRS